MGKKKDLDFKKIKVKIGKSKPSNNVTKFNIKTAKIVLPGQNKIKEEKKIKDYFSCNEKDLMDNLKFIIPLIIESINQKKEVMNKHKLDLTQSVWITSFRSKWVTPWDDIIEKFIEKIRSFWIYTWTIINNATSHKSLSVNEEAIRCANLYLQLIGDTSIGRSSGKKAIIIIKRYMKSTEKQKKLLALDLAVSLAKYSPSAFWYASRWKSAVFILGVLEKLLNNIDNHYETVINIDRFLSLASMIITSVIDGNRAGLVFVGEQQSQYDDIRNPPFDDLYYYNEKVIEHENSLVTDALDQWDNEDVEIHTKFDLNEFLIRFSNVILEKVSRKSMPISVWFDEEKSLKNLLNIVKILSRCSVRIKTNKLLENFIVKLMEQFPLVCEESVTMTAEKEEELSNEPPIEVENIDLMKNLSNKERKSRKQKMELDRKMEELCRHAKTNSSSSNKNNNKLKEELNLYTIALVYQCVVTDKICLTEPAVTEWVTTRCKQYILSRNFSSRNEITMEWLTLGKQIIQFSNEKYNQSAEIIRDLFVTFAMDVFIRSHSASKMKRLSLAVFVDACLLSNKFPDNRQIITINKQFWDLLIDLIVDELSNNSNNNNSIGQLSPHPTFRSEQSHYDVTLIKAAYLLFANNYPGVGALFRCSDISKKKLLKESFEKLTIQIKQTELDQSNHSKNFIWDYFSIDNVFRRDSVKEQLPPICSSIDDFFCQ